MSEKMLYVKTGIFSLILFALAYGYLSWLGIPNQLNKASADVATLLIAFSMILSSLCYFWNTFDSLIIYRKYLGMVGFAFAVVHTVISHDAIKALLVPEKWLNGAVWPVLNATIAMAIFAIMALISNQFMAKRLGGKWWRYLLRAGYLALIAVWFHVVLLKSGRWLTWYQGGMQTPPSLSLMVTGFVLFTLLMRVLLWLSTARKRRK